MGTRTRRERTDAIDRFTRRCVGRQHAIIFAERPCCRAHDLVVVDAEIACALRLRIGERLAARVGVKHVGEQLGADLGQPVVEFAVRFVGGDGKRFRLGEQIARIHTGVHGDDRHRGHAAPVANRGLNRRCATVEREHRGVNVQPQRHDVEQGLRDDAPVRRHHAAFGTERCEFARERTQFFRR